MTQSTALKSFVNQPYKDLAAILSSPQVVPALAGQHLFTKDGWSVEVLSASATNHSHTTASGVKLLATVAGDTVYPVHFGITATGDMTDKVRAMHEYANRTGKAVSYAGLPSVTLRAFTYTDTANQIDVNTDVDFAGCAISVVGAEFATPNAHPQRVFRTVDPLTPLVTITGNIDTPATNLLPGSFTPTKGLFSGTGYVKLTTSKLVPNRTEDGTTTFGHTFYLVDGKAKQPLTMDLTAHGTGVSLTYRKPSSKRIMIRNVLLNEGGWNNLCLFLVERNQVDFDGFEINQVTTAHVGDSLSHLLQVRDAGDLSIKNMRGPSRPYLTTGNYNFSVYSGAEIRLENVHFLERNIGPDWPAIGTNSINGLYAKNCTVNRLDAHDFAWNWFCEDVVFTEQGLVVGRASGIFELTRCRAIKSNLFGVRGDYGGYFEGCRVFINDCYWEPGTTNDSLYAVDLASSSAKGVGSSVPCYVPDIFIDGLHISANGASSVVSCNIIGIGGRSKAPSTAVIYAPDNISIKNVTMDAPIRWSIKIEWASFTRRGRAIDRSLFVLANVDGYTIHVDHGVLDVSPRYTVLAANAALLDVDFSQVGRPTIKFVYFTPTTVRLSNVTLWDFALPSGAEIDVMVTSCIGIGTGTGVFGGGGTSKRISTKVTGFAALPTGATYNLSSAAVLQGVVGAVVLPTGVTAAQALAGWVKS